MANDRRPTTVVTSPVMNADQLEAMLAELDEICRQARALTSSITVKMDQQRQQHQQVLGTRLFTRP